MAKTIPILYNVQHADKNANAKDYALLGEDELIVTTKFFTFQGEGPYAGWPAVFLRLSGCNFGEKKAFCQFCDTNFKLDQGTVYTHNELLKELEVLWQSPNAKASTKLLVITGGEPTLQPSLVQFIQTATANYGWQVQIETNGTQGAFAKRMSETTINFLTACVGPPKIVISPKASHLSGYGAEPSAYFKRLDSCLKFVVDADPNSPQHKLPAWSLDWEDSKDIYISPMAVYAKAYDGEVSDAWEPGLIDIERTRVNYYYARELVLKYRYKLSIQMHLFAAAP
jgi:7-carboxy-7-deazaguanine synthase